jgi:predicted metal-dependent HD superfamily phosphohydrolase
MDIHPVAGTNTQALELAIWFHDAIYSPLRGNNEQASADLASLRGLGAGNDFVRCVHALIMVTTHSGQPSSQDEALMVDIDLAILGSDRATFKVYEFSIRQEYRLVPGPLYRCKRKAILQSFLDRDAIYNTAPFAQSREEAARSNLMWAISRL